MRMPAIDAVGLNICSTLPVQSSKVVTSGCRCTICMCMSAGPTSNVQRASRLRVSCEVDAVGDTARLIEPSMTAPVRQGQLKWPCREMNSVSTTPARSNAVGAYVEVLHEPGHKREGGRCVPCLSRTTARHIVSATVTALIDEQTTILHDTADANLGSDNRRWARVDVGSSGADRTAQPVAEEVAQQG